MVSDTSKTSSRALPMCNEDEHGHIASPLCERFVCDQTPSHEEDGQSLCFSQASRSFYPYNPNLNPNSNSNPNLTESCSHKQSKNKNKQKKAERAHEFGWGNVIAIVATGFNFHPDYWTPGRSRTGSRPTRAPSTTAATKGGQPRRRWGRRGRTTASRSCAAMRRRRASTP